MQMYIWKFSQLLLNLSNLFLNAQLPFGMANNWVFPSGTKPRIRHALWQCEWIPFMHKVPPWCWMRVGRESQPVTFTG